MSNTDSSLPPWLIASADVDAWLSGTAIAHTVMHVTSPDEAKRIRDEGVDVARSSSGVCDGFYCSDRPWAPLAEAGTDVLEVAIRMSNPFRTQTPSALRVDLQEITGDYSAPQPDQVRRHLLVHGYDGVITEASGQFQADGPVYIALAEGTVRIVVTS